MAQTIFEPYRLVREMLGCVNAGQPPHTCLHYMRIYMRLLGLWPAERAIEQPLYYVYNILILTVFSSFVATIICDLYEASSDFVLLGEDLVVALGLYLILFKMVLFRSSVGLTDGIINEFDALHAKYAFASSNDQSNQRIRKWQQHFFIGEMFLYTGFLILSLLLFIAMSLQPIFTQETLPFRSKFPFGLDNPDEHPIAFVCIYGFQCFCVLYMLVSIVAMDSLGGDCFNQITLNLRILCEEIRNLGVGTTEVRLCQQLRVAVEFHQKIIGLINRINRVFYWNYIAQMGASTFMICLTAFEAILAQDQPMVAMKFQMYMFSAFMQLFYWCAMGNRTYYDVRPLINRINRVFYWNYIAQMGASTFMICLTAFEAILAQDQPMVAMKFQMYMFSAFMQLFYWCAMGNRTYYDSMEVATAAFEVHAWYDHSPRLQRNLMLIIERAQKPLEFRAKPLYGFTFASFTSILSTSYTYFTMLRTMSD